MNFNIAIIGGGLAGLSLSIDLKKRGYDVIVIEKENYPRHKVCGEYLSLESINYLIKICPSISSLSLPIIKNFKLTSTKNNTFNSTLALGGIGISRYLLDHLLFIEAKNCGVNFLLNTKALDVHCDNANELYSITTNKGIVNAQIVCNAAGRKSNFETKQKEYPTTITNYIGVKYHIKLNRNDSLIEIHNFPGGYCGISNIEENKSCLCYIVNSKKLNRAHNSIAAMEKEYLFKNNHLKKIFDTAEFLFQKPITISGINFLIKKPVTNNSFFIGDSAGSIAPITGNGMSNALRASSEIAKNIDSYFTKKINKQQLISSYNIFWKKEFSKRIKLSRLFQKLSEYPTLTNNTIKLFNTFPLLANRVINLSHGNPF